MFGTVKVSKYETQDMTKQPKNMQDTKQVKTVGQSKRAIVNITNTSDDNSSSASDEGSTTSSRKRIRIKLKNKGDNKVDNFMQRRQSEKEVDSDPTLNPDEEMEIVNYQCPHCIFSCLTDSDFTEHMKESHGKTIFCCVTGDCILWYLSQNGLRQHCKKVHLDELKCKQCDLVLLSPSLLNVHVDTNHTGKKGVCPSCQHSFTRADDAKCHHKKNCPKNLDRCISCKHFLKK